MRSVRYIHEEPNIRRTGALPGPIVLGGFAIACGVFGWLALRDGGGGVATAFVEEARAVKAAIVQTSSPGAIQSGGALRDCATCPEIVVLPTGFYTVGATEHDLDARPQEKPRRSASITRRFAMARYETTVGDYKAFAAATKRAAPACAGAALAADEPQNCVTFADAVAFAEWVSGKAGHRYRLPTADEWEFAALAHGSPAAGKAQDGLFPVSDTTANGFGLHGMHGNIAELVSDCWTTPEGEKAGVVERDNNGACLKRTVKDGSWLDGAREARPSAKRAIRADMRSERVGLRLVRDLDARELGQ